MADKIVKGYLALVLIASVAAIISDLRFFSPNQILGAISIINILPTIIVMLGAVPIILYVLMKKFSPIYIIPPVVELITIIFYIGVMFATAGEGPGLTTDYVVSNLSNIFLAITSTYLVLIRKSG